MFKSIRWLMLVLVSVLCIPIAIINVQAYDDSDLRALLTSSVDCPEPCFLGIRPGVTSFDRAIRILETHDWVDQLDLTDRYNNRWTFALWQWNGSQALLPHTSDQNSLSAGIEASGDLSVYTAITPVEVWWLYGPPKWVQQVKINGGREQYIFGYPDHKLLLLVEVNDCTNRLRVLTSAARLTFARWILDLPERFPNDYIIAPELSDFSNVNPCTSGQQS